MKLFILILFAVLLSACGEKTDTSMATDNSINGRYVADDKTSYLIHDGVLTKEARGPFPARSSTYKIVNNRIEYKFDNNVYFIIVDDKTLNFMGMLEYKKV